MKKITRDSSHPTRYSIEQLQAKERLLPTPTIVDFAHDKFLLREVLSLQGQRYIEAPRILSLLFLNTF